MAALTIEKQRRAGLQDCTLEDLMFPVEMVQQMDFACNSNCTHDIFGYIGPDAVKTRLNTCSDEYELVPNSKIFRPIKYILANKGINFEEKYMHLNNARFYAEYRILDKPYQVAGHDTIYPMLKVQHSYNGLVKYMISFGYFRMVCTNGLTIPVKEKEHLNFAIVGKHTSMIKESIKKLFHSVEMFVNLGNDSLVNFDHMADRMVDKWEDRVIEVLGFNKIAIVENKKVDTLGFIKNVISKEANNMYGGKVNDWLIYNGINQYINNNDLNVKTPEVRADLDRKVLEFMMGE